MMLSKACFIITFFTALFPLFLSVNHNFMLMNLTWLLMFFLYGLCPIWLIPYQHLLGSLSMDHNSFFLSFLTLLIFYLMMCMLYSTWLSNTNFILKTNLIFILLIICFITFLMMKIINFYILFEISLIPIFLIILGWGYQPERKYASMIMFFYTLSFSMPLLIFIILLNQHAIMNFQQCNFINNNNDNIIFSLVSWAIILAFLVKFPLYGFHIWLPQAHVEAPVEGSMILAAILLKLGGIGMIRMSPFLFNSCLNYTYIMFFSLLGGALSTFLCLYQTDMKIIIAYSSVSHMSFAISLLLLNSNISYPMILLILVIHGNLSASLFYMVNIKYMMTNSRNIFYSGNSSLLSYFTLFYFTLLLFNMAGPPSISMIMEMISVSIFINYNFLLMLPLMFILFMSTIFNMKMFVSLQKKIVSQNLKNFKGHPMSIYFISCFQFTILIFYPLWYQLLI